MSFFVGQNAPTVLEAIMDPATLMKAAPEYYGERFAAIAAMRAEDDGTGHKGQEFRRVASFTNVPLFMAEKLANPEFLKDKRKFYAFLDRHPEYVTYQRKGAHGRAEAARNALPLSALGIDYPGGPETIEDFEAVDVSLEPVIEPPTDHAEVLP